jgi:hypothetical protein
VNILDINPQTPGLVQSFPVSTVATPLFSTTVDPIANMALSNHGTEVSFAGWTTKGTTGQLGTSPGIPRGVGILDSSGNYGQPSTYNPATLSSPDQPHAAYSPDGVNWYFGDTSGMYYNGGTVPLTNSDATLSIKGFSSTTYALHTLGSAFVLPNGSDAGSGTGATAISSVTPTTPSGAITSVTYSPVVTLPNAAHDFIFVSSFNQAADTLYVTTDEGVSKFSGSGSSWVFESTFSLTGAKGIAAQVVKGVGVELFVTVDVAPALGAATLDEITDVAAHNSPLITTGPVVLYTAPSLDALEGVSMAPTPEAGSLVAGLGAWVGMVLRRRR